MDHSYLNKSYCPFCNKEISKLENPKYLTYTYYYNVRKKKAGADYKIVSEEKIADKLIQYVDENLTFSADLAEWSKQYITELKDIEINEALFKDKKTVTDKVEYEAKKARLRVMLRDEQITSGEYSDDLAALNKTYCSGDSTNNSVDWYGRMNQIVDISLCMKEVLEKGCIQTKREVLSALGSNLVWDDKELSIINDNVINKLVEGIKRAKSENPEFEPKKYVVHKGLYEKTGPLIRTPKSRHPKCLLFLLV